MYYCSWFYASLSFSLSLSRFVCVCFCVCMCLCLCLCVWQHSQSVSWFRALSRVRFRSFTLVCPSFSIKFAGFLSCVLTAQCLYRDWIASDPTISLHSAVLAPAAAAEPAVSVASTSLYTHACVRPSRKHTPVHTNSHAGVLIIHIHVLPSPALLTVNMMSTIVHTTETFTQTWQTHTCKHTHRWRTLWHVSCRGEPRCVLWVHSNTGSHRSRFRTIMFRNQKHVW